MKCINFFPIQLLGLYFNLINSPNCSKTFTSSSTQSQLTPLTRMLTPSSSTSPYMFVINRFLCSTILFTKTIYIEKNINHYESSIIYYSYNTSPIYLLEPTNEAQTKYQLFTCFKKNQLIHTLKHSTYIET